MEKTTNYQLNQWSPDDKVQRVDFNADNQKIDAAIRAVDKKADGLSGSKADQSALDALSATVTGHTAALDQKGNCQIAAGTYTGDGTYGKANARTLTFPFQPKLVIVQCTAGALHNVTSSGNTDKTILTLVRPLSVFYTYQGLNTTYVTWGEHSVSWYDPNGYNGHMNMANRIYTYVAFG